MINNPQITQINSERGIEDSRLEYSSILNFEFLFLNSRKAGFTLFEMLVVIIIISVTTALIMPSLWSTGGRALKAEAKKLGSTLRYINDEAVGKKQSYILKIDISKSEWGFEGGKEARSYHLAKDIMFKDVLLPSLGEIVAGEVLIEFGPLGPEEPLVLHLIKDKKEYTVTFNHITGRSKIIEGYVL